MLPLYPALPTPSDCVKGRRTVPQLPFPRGASSISTPSPPSHTVVIVSDEGSSSDDEELCLDSMKARCQTEDRPLEDFVSDVDPSSDDVD